MDNIDTKVFKVGDRVVPKREMDGNETIIGKPGTVIRIRTRFVTVEFDDPIRDGHRGQDGQGKAGHCWDVYNDYLTKIDINKDNALELLINKSINEEAYKKIMEE